VNETVTSLDEIGPDRLHGSGDQECEPDPHGEAEGSWRDRL